MKNFNDFYTNVIKDDNQELEKLRNGENKKVLSICLSIFGCALLFCILPPYLGWMIYIGIIFLIIYSVSVFKTSKNYTNEFKKRVMSKMVTGFKEFKEYEPKRGIANFTYREANFESYDYYSSEDYFSGSINEKFPIEIAEVHTEDESTDQEGHRTRTTVFHGVFSQIKLSVNVTGMIQISPDFKGFGKSFFNKAKVEMDSSEFEKRFDVYADDKIMAMQILTSDVMDTLINFWDTYKIKYEIKIFNNNIFLRFRTGPVFEPKYMRKALEYDFLKRYYDILEFIVRASEEIIKAIEETR